MCSGPNVFRLPFTASFASRALGLSAAKPSVAFADGRRCKVKLWKLGSRMERMRPLWTFIAVSAFVSGGMIAFQAVGELDSLEVGNILSAAVIALGFYWIGAGALRRARPRQQDQ